jgi:hypothetical protein
VKDIAKYLYSIAIAIRIFWNNMEIIGHYKKKLEFNFRFKGSAYIFLRKPSFLYILSWSFRKTKPEGSLIFAAFRYLLNVYSQIPNSLASYCRVFGFILKKTFESINTILSLIA